MGGVNLTFVSVSEYVDCVGVLACIYSMGFKIEDEASVIYSSYDKCTGFFFIVCFVEFV